MEEFIHNTVESQCCPNVVPLLSHASSGCPIAIPYLPPAAPWCPMHNIFYDCLLTAPMLPQHCPLIAIPLPPSCCSFAPHAYHFRHKPKRCPFLPPAAPVLPQCCPFAIPLLPPAAQKWSRQWGSLRATFGKI